MNDFKNLQVWNKSIELAKAIYIITKKFPKEENYGLVSQMKRAAISVSSNIAEGCGRRTDKDFRNFLYNALGSIRELETQVIISKELDYLTLNQFQEISLKIDSLSGKLVNLIRAVSKKC